MKMSELLEGRTKKAEAPKPRNFVAKNAINTGAGQHKDKKKSEKQGDVKHKKSLMPMEDTLSELSTEKLAQYKKASYADAKKADADGDYARGDKRFKGINKATNKQFDNDLKKHGQQGVAEVSDKTRNSYVDKATSDYGHANFAARASKSHPGLEKYSKEQDTRAKKRAAGLNRALSDKRTGRVGESASAGATSAANVGVGPVYKNKKPKMQKPGTNALDGDNLMTGGSIVKR